MVKQHLILLVCLISCLCVAQEPTSVVLKSATQLELDASYDKAVNPSMKRQLDRFKRRMDQTVNRTIGTVPVRMTSGRPESTLSNFLADQLLEKARMLSDEKVDLTVINMGGIRSTFNKGDIMVNDVYKVLPFENTLVVVTLTGKSLMALFQYMAKAGGEGLSGARLIINNNKVVQAFVNNAPVDTDARYTVATFDYLAQGNGGFTVFEQAIQITPLNRSARACVIEQIEALTAAGKPIRASLDGRITFQKNKK